jgi:hypothetical protein
MKGVGTPRCDRRPPQAIPGHSRLQQRRADQHCAARSPCNSKQGDLLTIPHTRAGRGVKTVAPACSTDDEQGRDVRTPSLSTVGPAGPAYGEGRRSPRALFSSVFSLSSFPLSLSLVYPRSFSWSIKGKAGHPFRESFFAYSEALQLYVTFTRDLKLHPSLASL